jgi:hypothetical protein
MFDDQSIVNPPKFSNLAAWWDASQITGLANSTPVSSWPDLSGHSYNLIQSTGIYQPLYKTNRLNGLPTLSFDGVDDYLNVAFGTTFNQPNTIFGVGKFNNGEDWQYAYDGNDSSFRNGLLIYSAWPYFSALTAGGDIDVINYVNGIAGNWGQVTSIYNGAGSYLRTNRSFTASGNPGSDGLNGFIAGNSAALSTPLNGELAELIIYNRELSYYEIYQLENYLAKKWGIQTFTIKATDNFTRTDSTITMGNCRSNQTWTAGSYQDVDLPVLGISTNYARFVSITGTDSHAWVETGASNCIITAKIKFDSETDDKGILFRRQDENNYWYAHINSSDSLLISRCLAGVREDIASAPSASTAPGDEEYWRVFLVGDYISAGSAQGKKYVTVFDSNLQTATKHGLYNASGTAGMCNYFAVEI